MDKKAISYFLVGLLVGLLAATSGFALLLKQLRTKQMAGARQKVTLKLGHGLDPSHPVHRGMEHMKERLEALSGGAMTIDIYPSGVLGSETECLEQVQNGALAMTKSSTAAIESFVPELAVFGLPYLFRDADHFWKVLDGAVGQGLLQKGQQRFLRGLCYYDAGSRSFYTIKKPILTPSDLRGMKIRVQNSRLAMDMISTMGGAPTPVAWGELYTALQQGMVDGAENNPPSLVTSRHYEVCKHYVLDEHTRIPDILLMDTRVWNSLTTLQQTWLQQAANESSKFQRALWQEATVADLKSLEAKGVKVYRVGLQPFAQAVQPLLDSYKGTTIGELADQIRKME